MICTMCEEIEATTEYGAPVCQPCYDSLVSLSGDLAEMEAHNPALAELARRVEHLAAARRGVR